MSDEGHRTTPLGVVHSPFCTKPDVHNHCACGANRGCRTCGYGAGAYPCECDRKRLRDLSPMGGGPNP